MKRRHFVADLKDGDRTIDTAETFAWNSAIKASEALVRKQAEQTGEAFIGSDPQVWGKPPTGVYRRAWRGGVTGKTLTVEMQEVHS